MLAEKKHNTKNDIDRYCESIGLKKKYIQLTERQAEPKTETDNRSYQLQ